MGPAWSPICISAALAVCFTGHCPQPPGNCEETPGACCTRGPGRGPEGAGVGGWDRGCKKCRWCDMRSGSSRLALPGAGKSPEKEPQAPGAFCPRAWLCKSWGKGQEFRELVHSRSPRCQQVRDGGGSRGLQQPGRFRNENLQLSMQWTANRFFGFQSPRL